MRTVPVLVALVLVAASSLLLVSVGGRELAGARPSATPERAAPHPDTPLRTPVSTGDPGRTALMRPAGSTCSTCSIRGRAVSTEGEPLRRARVALRATGHTTATGADGGFVLAGVSVASSAWLELAHGAATLRREITLWPGAALDVGDLVLELSATIRGVVVDAEGVPVPDASVMDTASVTDTSSVTLTAGAAGRGAARATADREGRFELAGLARGRYRLHASADGYAGRPGGSIDVRSGETVEGVRLLLDPARVVAGRVTDAQGEPLAGARIEARLSQPEEAAPVRARSDSDGVFELGPVPIGPLRLQVERAGFLPFGRICSSDARDLRIVLTRTRAVFGRVEDAATGEPVVLSTVQVLVSSGNETGPWRSLGPQTSVARPDAEDGRFRVPLQIHRTARVVVRCQGRPPVVSGPFWMGREDVGPLVLRARAGVRTPGTLRDEAGRPVPNADIRVTSGVGEGCLVQTGAPIELDHRHSSSSGSFELHPLPPGAYTIQVRRPGYMPVHQRIEIDAAAKPLDLRLHRAGVVRGRVDDPAGVPQRLRVVAISLDPGRKPASPQTRLPSAPVISGAFVFEALEPGTYGLELVSTASGEPLEEPRSTVVVDIGRDAYVELELGG